jgi:hypothetical protein
MRGLACVTGLIGMAFGELACVLVSVCQGAPGVDPEPAI